MSSERNAQLQRYHIGRMTKLLSEKDAEIARLRDALEWIEARIDGTALCLDEIQARARKAQDRVSRSSANPVLFHISFCVPYLSSNKFPSALAQLNNCIYICSQMTA